MVIKKGNKESKSSHNAVDKRYMWDEWSFNIVLLIPWPEDSTLDNVNRKRGQKNRKLDKLFYGHGYFS